MDATTRHEGAQVAGMPDVIDARRAGTLWGLFCERLRRTPDRVAYRDYDPVREAWRDHTWRAIADRVDRFRVALTRSGLDPGDRIGILLPNGIDWVCLDIAAHACDLVVVALYPYDSAANHAYVLGHSDTRLVLLDTGARWQALTALRSEFSALEHVWIGDGGAPPPALGSRPAVHNLVDVLVEGETPPARVVQPGALATLIYTSGTTGRPKGVMLSHFALLWNAEATAKVIPPRLNDVFLSILPLAHAFERTLGFYLPMMGGSTVAYARSPQTLREDLAAVRPTVLLGVPRLFERMHAAVRASVADNFVKRTLLRAAAALGWERFQAVQQKRRLALATRLGWWLLEPIVAAPVLAAFGGRLRVAVSGGAPLDQKVARFLLGLGLPLVEGYGLTEAAPVVTATTVDESVPGSVGRPLRGVELTITAEGELRVRTASVMTGYWKDAALTARTLDPAGWLATGDLAEIKDGRIFFRGRMKDMIILSIGEKISPTVVESEITGDPLFLQAMVLGNGRPFLVAVIVVDRKVWDQFARDNAIAPGEPNAQSAKERILQRIEADLAAFPRHARVRAVHLTFEPWTIEAGLMTPTLKIRRDALEHLFAKEIAALYESRQGTHP